MATRGPGEDIERSVAAGGGQGNLRGLEHRSSGQQQIIFMSLCALGHDVLAGREGARRKQTDALPRNLDVLDHGHGIGAQGNGAAGHDLPGGAQRQRSGRGISSTRSSDHGERFVRGGFSGAAGKTVAG
jgi:hypothetical protein